MAFGQISSWFSVERDLSADLIFSRVLKIFIPYFIRVFPNNRIFYLTAAIDRHQIMNTVLMQWVRVKSERSNPVADSSEIWRNDFRSSFYSINGKNPYVILHNLNIFYLRMYCKKNSHINIYICFLTKTNNINNNQFLLMIYRSPVMYFSKRFWIYIIINVMYGTFRKRLGGIGRAIARWNRLGLKTLDS